MNKQRESVYTLRREILEGKIHVTEDEMSDKRGYLLATAEDLIDDKIDLYFGKDVDVDDVGRRGAAAASWPSCSRWTTTTCAACPSTTAAAAKSATRLWRARAGPYHDKEKLVPRDILRRVERDIMLQIVDTQWKDHLYSLDHLKEGISLRSYGQRDPLVEYKKESFTLFQDMRSRIEAEMVRYLWWLRPVEGEPDGDRGRRLPAAAPRKPAPLDLQRPVRRHLPGLPAAGGGRRRFLVPPPRRPAARVAATTR